MFPQLVPERERKKGNYLFEMYTHTDGHEGVIADML